MRGGHVAGPEEVRQQRTYNKFIGFVKKRDFYKEKLITLQFTSVASLHNMLSSNNDYIQVLAGKVFYVYSAGNQDHKSAICID